MQGFTVPATPTWRSFPQRPLACAPLQRLCCVRANCAAAAFALEPHAVGTREQRYQQQVLNKMLKFMGPAVLIPLADPLMAVVDTIFVGQFAGTTDLAAMGPANMLFSFALYVFRSLQVSTQSLVAAELRSDNLSEAAQLLGTGLTLAAVLGMMGGCLLGLNSHTLVMGTGVKDLTLVQPASAYLSVRACALPAVIITAVAQSGKLAQQDSLTPCLSVMLSVAFSLIANVIVVGHLGWGLKGAAITTVATQYLGATALLYMSHHPSSQLKPDWRLPRPDQVWTYLHTMAPLTTTFVSKNTCYLILQSAAAGLATMSLAAHQAAFSIWTLFTWAMSPVEQACLAYLPTATHRWQQRATTQLVMTLGTGVALATGGVLAALLLYSPGLLVKDVAVHPLMSSVAPQATLSIILIGIDMAATAVNIALRDYGYVARSYLFTLAATTAYFISMRSQGLGLPGVWWGLCMFFGMRFVQSVGRTMVLMDWWPAAATTTESESVARAGQLQKQKQRLAVATGIAGMGVGVLPVSQVQAAAHAQADVERKPQQDSGSLAPGGSDLVEETDRVRSASGMGPGIRISTDVDAIRICMVNDAGGTSSNVVPFQQLVQGSPVRQMESIRVQ